VDKLNSFPVKVVLFILFLIPVCGKGQKMTTRQGYCGIYFKSMDDLYRQKKAELDFYQFKAGQKIASIGAQCGHWEAVYAATADNVDFYLEDIDTTHFNQRQVGFAWNYYDSLRGSPTSSRFILITGTERSTMLPPKTFDKVLIINSFHEFSMKDEMLADIKNKLKPDGILYIDEPVPKYEGELHGGCKKRMVSAREMNAILEKNGFVYFAAKDLQFRKKRTVRTIYAFKLNTNITP
jgi:predicted methyltransferase